MKQRNRVVLHWRADGGIVLRFARPAHNDRPKTLSIQHCGWQPVVQTPAGCEWQEIRIETIEVWVKP
jgi:hypothetical protein